MIYSRWQSHAGSAVLAQVAGKLGLTRALSLGLAQVKQRRRGRDLGRVICDLAVMLADDGERVADLGAVRDQQALFAPVASDSTAFRVIDRIAVESTLVDAMRPAHAQARERFWELHGAPQRLTIDVDATLITAHSEKEQAAGNYYKGDYGFHPLQAYADETREALGGMLRPSNAGTNTAADHVTVLDRALEQVPAQHIERIEILVRAAVQSLCLASRCPPRALSWDSHANSAPSAFKRGGRNAPLLQDVKHSLQPDAAPRTRRTT